MSNFSTSLITIKYQFEDGDGDDEKEKTFKVSSNYRLADLLLNLPGRKVFAVCYGDNQMVIPIGNNLVATWSSQDNSKSSIFYFDKEIISSNESVLTIQLKKIGKNISYYSFNLYPFVFYRFRFQLQSKSKDR